MTDTASVRLAPGDPAPDFTLPDAEGRNESAAYNVKATGHVAKLRRDLGLD